MALTSCFSFQLPHTILPGLVTVGSYDGKHPSVTYATSGGKVVIHTPAAGGEGGTINTLNVNQKITAIAAGRMDAASHDVLFVGTSTNLLGYDIEKNADLLYKEVPDGIMTLSIGSFGKYTKPLVIVGGNCALQGFDVTGNEAFWTVTGDNVSAVALCDIMGSGSNELLVGSDDFEIRVFRNDEVVAEITETDRILVLCPLTRTSFSYILSNGTVGVYDRTSRVWRQKTKNVPVALLNFDLNEDGRKEVIIGWDDGTVEVRSDLTGEVLARDQLKSSVAGIVMADYRGDGTPQVVCCAVDGELRGYKAITQVEAAGKLLSGQTVNEHALQELNARKQDLIRELKAYDQNVKKARSANSEPAILPTTTRVVTELDCVPGGLELTISTNNDTIVKCVVISADQLFTGESSVYHPLNPQRFAKIPIRPEKDVGTEMKLKAIVGYKGSENFHVFEASVQLPRFAMYVAQRTATMPEPRAGVVFTIAERVSRIKTWMKQSFVIPAGMGLPDGNMEQAFLSARDGTPLFLKFTQETSTFQIRTENMELAGDLIQDFAASAGITELTSSCDFPAEMERFAALLSRVNDFDSTRAKLSAEMADSSNLVKSLVVKAEDSRILNQIPSMKRVYATLYDVNRALIGEYRKRANNQRELLASLKDVNLVIQRAARLRVGAANAKVIAQCREALKTKNTALLMKIIAVGSKE